MLKRITSAAALSMFVSASTVLSASPRPSEEGDARIRLGGRAQAHSFQPIPGEVLVRLSGAPTPAGLASIAASVPEIQEWVEYPVHAVGAAGRNAKVRAGAHPLALRRKVFVDPAADVVEVAKRISQLPGVLWAEPNGMTEMALAPSDARYGEQYGPAKIGCETVWNLTAGGSNHVILAVADTGLNFLHEDLQENLVWHNPDEIPNNDIDDDGNGFVDDTTGWDFYYSDKLPFDGQGHGTHVTGIAAARLSNGVGIAGVAGNVTVMPLKVFSDAGNGTWEAIELAVYYAVDNGAHVINYSGGGYGGTQGMAEAAQYAYDNGVTFVAACGNGSSENPYYPAAYDSVIAVMGTNRNDNRYSSSNRGDYLDVGAPGVDILSTYIPGADQYATITGTSMASPHVAGAAAILYTLNPALTVDQVTNVLRRTAVDLGDPGFDRIYGYGRIDLAAAAVDPDVSGAPIPCDQISKFKASCSGGALKIIIKMVDGTYSGDAVVFGVNGVSFRAPLDRGSQGQKAKLIRTGLTGTQTVTLDVPAGCKDALVVECP